MDVTDTYYAGEAFIGYGTQLEIGQNDGSPESFVAVADVMSITPGDMTTGIVDKTHLRSPNRHREKLATIRDSGPFVIAGNWRPSHGSQSNVGGDGFDKGLAGLWAGVEERNMRIVLSNGSPAIVWPFRGVVSKFQPGAITLDAKVDFTAEITPLGDFSTELP